MNCGSKFLSYNRNKSFGKLIPMLCKLENRNILNSPIKVKYIITLNLSALENDNNFFVLNWSIYDNGVCTFILFIY